MESGLDSLGSVELWSSLASTFNMELPSTFAFDYPTIKAMTAFVCAASGTETARAADAAAAGSTLPSSRCSKPDSQQSSIQLVGLACKLPSRAEGLAGFWAVAAGCLDVQTVIPQERWDLERVYAPEAGAGKMAVTSR